MTDPTKQTIQIENFINSINFNPSLPGYLDYRRKKPNEIYSENRKVIGTTI